MTALVCSGRSRLKVRNEVSKLSAGKLSCRAINSPTSRPIRPCLLYTSDAADERSSVDLGGRRIIQKKKTKKKKKKAVS